MSTVSDATILNAALLMVGAEPLSTFSDNDSTGINEVVSSLYVMIKRARLEHHPWRFAMKISALTSLATPTNTLTNYTYAYQIPSDSLRVLGMWEPYMGTFEVFGRELFTNSRRSDAIAVDLLYVRDAEPSYWSNEFIHALTVELASRIAIPVRENRSLAEQLTGEVGSLWSGARLRDSQSSVNVGLEDRVLALANRYPSRRT